MERKLNIHKHLCQYAEIQDEALAKRACGIVALCITLNHFGVQTNSETLLKEGIAMGGLLDGVGWKHATICALAKKYGVNSYRQDYIDGGDLELRGVEKMKRMIDAGIPVIFSIQHKDRDSTHLAVFAGYDDDNFYISDPEMAEDDLSAISQEDFMERWRRLVIYFEPDL